jgi:hypothetical protein
MDEPAPERRAISGVDRHFLQFSMKVVAHGCGKSPLVAQRPTRELEANVGDDDAGQN